MPSSTVDPEGPLPAPAPRRRLPALGSLSREAVDFIDDAHLTSLLGQPADPVQVRELIAKALDKHPLEVAEAAVLLNADDPALAAEIFDAARRLKREVYGRRIVLFAPLYIGNLCVNDCTYCGFRRSNREAVRRTLDTDELREQVEALQRAGHRRLIVVFGEHPRYGPDVIADTVRRVYEVRTPRGEIRRVSVNAAPLDVEGFRTVARAEIATYQIFQETYHHATYAAIHPTGTRKADYLWRLDAMDRAMEAGIEDVGIGALFGLHDWRFEVLGLVAHARHLEARHGCGPHTISFPRMRPASGVDADDLRLVGDDDFKRLVAILRLSVPYTGMILTAREPAAVRDEVLGFGVSQMDAGSRIELGGYTEAGDGQQQVREREQFELGDVRSLDEVVRQLLDGGHIPSFCTACYRLGRTGEQFMEYAIPGFIERLCTPNALGTLAEYLVDFAGEATRRCGEHRLACEVAAISDESTRATLIDRIGRIRTTEERDLFS